MASGEWRVASGEWRVASGEWRNFGTYSFYVNTFFLPTHFYVLRESQNKDSRNTPQDNYSCSSALITASSSAVNSG